MMYLTHTNSIYTEEITLMDHVTYPQYAHEISNGGMLVARGIKTMPEELVNYTLQGKYNADTGTPEFITNLLESPKKVGLIFSAGNTLWMGYNRNVKVSDRYPTHKIVTLGCTQVYAGYLANSLGSFQYVSTDCTSCISGHSAWYTASVLLRLGELDAVVVVAVDHGVSEENLHIFGEAKISKLKEEEGDPSVIKFRVGQGCNISVFESPDCVRGSDNTPLAKIRDIKVISEHHNSPLGMSKGGIGYRTAMEAVDTTGIDFVKTHGTFTSDNSVEEQIIKDLFGDIPIINYKLRIGHTMGASTAVETALAIKEETGTFLSLGAGMGNAFSSVVVEIM